MQQLPVVHGFGVDAGHDVASPYPYQAPWTMSAASLSQIQPPALTRFVGSATQAGPPVPALPVAELPAEPVVLPEPEPVVLPDPVVPAEPLVLPAPLVLAAPVAPAAPVSDGVALAQPK